MWRRSLISFRNVSTRNVNAVANRFTSASSSAISTSTTHFSSSSSSASSASSSSSSSSTPSFNWNAYFAQFEEQDRSGLTPELQQRLEQVIAENDLELSALFEPLFGKTAGAPEKLTLAKNKIAEIERFVNSTPPQVKPLDFAAYRSKIADKAAVDALEAEYKTIRPPSYGFSVKPFEKHVTFLVDQAKKFQDDDEAYLVNLKERLAKLKDLKARLHSLSVDDILAEHPEWVQETLEKVEHPDYERYTLHAFKGQVGSTINTKNQEDHHHH